jgi:hypothetical protein
MGNYFANAFHIPGPSKPARFKEKLLNMYIKCMKELITAINRKNLKGESDIKIVNILKPEIEKFIIDNFERLAHYWTDPDNSSVKKLKKEIRDHCMTGDFELSPEKEQEWLEWREWYESSCRRIVDQLLLLKPLGFQQAPTSGSPWSS